MLQAVRDERRAISWLLNPALVRRMFRPLWPGLVGRGEGQVRESGRERPPG